MEGKGMLQMITMVAHMSSQEQLVESLETAIEKYKLEPSKKAFIGLVAPCHLVIAKVMNSGESLIETMENQEKLFSTADMVQKMMDPNKQ